MAVVRHFALNLVRQCPDKRSIKRRRKCAAWDPKISHRHIGCLEALTSTRCPASQWQKKGGRYVYPGPIAQAPRVISPSMRDIRILHNCDFIPTHGQV